MSRLSKNIIYNLFGQGILLILGFVAVKFIFKQLGEDALGIIYFSATVNGIICTALELGICSTTVREVSGHFKSEPDYIKNLIRTFSSFYWFFYLVVGVAIYLLAPILVEKWIMLKTMDFVTAVYILRIMGIASLTALPKSFYASLLSGLQRMEFNNIIDVVVTGLQQFGTILILVMGGDLFIVIYWYAACYCIGLCSYLVVCAGLFPVKAFVPGYSSGVIKRNFHYASRMIFISTSATIITQVDKVCMSKLLPLGMLGYYGFTYGLVSRGAMLTSAISKAVFPSFSALFKSGDRFGLMAQYRKMQDLICFISLPLLAAVPFALLPIFTVVFNPEIARIMLLPATILCLGFYLSGAGAVPYIVSLAMGRPDIAARTNFYCLFVTVPATILLVYYLGMIGASASMVVFYLFNYMYSLPRICSECMEFPVWKWYVHVLKILLLGGLTYGIAWLILILSNAFSIVYLIIAYMSASITFFSGAYCMISDELRESLALRLQRR
jgi:O-antigen/teichoic acid export membrane protein